jgi:hypothetical protein
MIVKTMLTYNGNPSKNQYIVTLNENIKAFQSYDTVIAFYDYVNNIIFENDNAWMSKTTQKYYTKWRVYNTPMNPSTRFIKINQEDITKMMEYPYATITRILDNLKKKEQQ